ncbi:GlcNAc-transferase family protein [Magnetospirillum sp. UT-4]|uniref:GlcNAc-transferase family protein n=1 Tax=Magnetospirillum sp. UT-4 TaxID=2681467 RepID=UPI0013815BB3|nr:GlcNAc-transferase family protein [Magnetospirillum sp. UT-4]CAA7619556.1 conserved hypothetical protein [Magnetospirillum sp. UT-4]
MAKRPRIFVNIASYRDTECQHTVRDLFSKAKHPDRVFVGICWQFIPGEDDDCFQVVTRPDQVRVIEVNANESKGVCWARSQVQSLWRGEEFTLQIDSHMRFVEHWDELLLTMIGECDSPKPVISTYPPSYEPPDQLSEPTVSAISASEFDKNGILKFRAHGSPLPEPPPPPQPNHFIAAGLLFGPSSINTDVPYDPYLYFHGEEISLAVRLFTHGYDVFTPNRCIAFHDYTNARGRKRHWDDFEWAHLNALSFNRIRHLLGIAESDDPEVLREMDRYGLGSVRSLAEFERSAKVDFKNRLIDGMSDIERVEAMAPDERSEIAHTFFVNIWRSNGWGHAESRSGSGANLAQTEIIKARLVDAFAFLGAEAVADAGCGEMNWMKTVVDRFRFYFGFDLVGDLVTELRTKHARRHNCFFSKLDIMLDVMPRADVILCRDVLTHYPTCMVRAAFDNFKRSGARYVAATTFTNTENKPDNLIGGWQPMNLMAEPFNLPQPRILLSEDLKGTTKSIGIWAISDLP